MKYTRQTQLTLSATALLMLSGHAWSAGHADIQFSGSVSSTTCDLGVEINGASSNSLSLGTVAPGATGTAKSFALKLADRTQTGCSALTAATPTVSTATITWSGASLGTTGIANQATGSTAATGAVVTLKAVNATVANQGITSGQNTSTFTVTNLTGSTGAKFEAALVGGSVAGAYSSSLAFTVSYS
ncbi:fimbrial protein [Salmonella enterica subsp. enterica serovar Virchow]|nr:fimbrial protein [Salmonella enterica subsp. enterica serovar Virchow]